MRLTSQQLQDARVVADDLRYLMDEWVPCLDTGTIRRQSPLLRRLLVEGHYARAWRTLGLPAEPYSSAPSLDAMLGGAERDFIQTAFAPPGQTVREAVLAAGSQVELTIIESTSKGDLLVLIPGYQHGIGSVLAAIPRDIAAKETSEETAVTKYFGAHVGRRTIRGQPISAYLSSPAALITKGEITRRDVIKYVANKLGGVHFDPKRTGTAGQRLALLDQPLAKLHFGKISNFTTIYAELLSIGEYLAESGDAARFRDAFDKVE